MRIQQPRIVLALCSVVLVACGGSSDSGLKATGGAGGGAAAGGGAGAGGSAGAGLGGAAGTATGGAGGVAGVGAAGGGGAGAVGGGSGYTLENVCQKTQPQGCGWSSDCCKQSGFGYDEKACIATALAGCQKNVDEVKAGTMTFDPSKVDACLTTYQTLLSKCTLGVSDYLAALDGLKTCGLAFQGKLSQGTSCDRDEQCAPSADPNVFVSCSDTTGKCVSAKRLPLSANCAIGDGVADFCAPGLYCDATFAPVPPYPGVCKTATAEGQKCNGFKPYNLECGAGFYCNKQSSVCTKAKLGGAACIETVECQSYTCSAGKCGALAPVVDQKSCTG
ncbi:MAG: hypothetical protein IPI67_31775 [Myxococcales bacterium]|nr:hypothetical protein [Myxococcales bacterium]